MEGSTGTDVKRALTLYGVMTLPGSSLTCCMFCTKCIF